MSSKAANIAHNLGLRSGKDIIYLLQRMKSEGLVEKVSSQWQLCQTGATGSGGTKALSATLSVDQSPVSASASGVRGSVGHVNHTTSVAEPSRRRSNGTVSDVILADHIILRAI